jgi:hypothetical protein
MTRLLHSRTMTFPFELHPNTSGTGGAVAKDCPDQKHAVAFALPFIPLLDSARRPRALALMRELRPEAADPAVQFCSLPRDQESRRISGFQRPAIKTSRNTALENDSCLVPGCGPCHRHRFVPPLSLSLRGAPVPEVANHLGRHEMRREEHRAKTPIWARPGRRSPGHARHLSAGPAQGHRTCGDQCARGDDVLVDDR